MSIVIRNDVEYQSNVQVQSAYLVYKHLNVTTGETAYCGIRISDIIDYQWIPSSSEDKRHAINILVRGDTRPRYFKGETALTMYQQLRNV
jgi:hypothetical protein